MVAFEFFEAHRLTTRVGGEVPSTGRRTRLARSRAARGMGPHQCRIDEKPSFADYSEFCLKTRLDTSLLEDFRPIDRSSTSLGKPIVSGTPLSKHFNNAF